MKPIYECNKCHYTFTENVESHDDDTKPYVDEESGHPLPPCSGELKPCFYANDLLKEIETLKSRVGKIEPETISDPEKAFEHGLSEGAMIVLKGLTAALNPKESK